MTDQTAPEPDDAGHPEPPTAEELSSALPVQPDPRQPAYDAVYEYIRGLGPYLPPGPVHRNALIWRAVQAALGATHVGRCVSSHCVENDHMVFVETPSAPAATQATELETTARWWDRRLAELHDAIQPAEPTCTCADGGDCFAPAGHYADCPSADQTTEK